MKSGEYGDPSEVVREALRLLRDEQEAKAIEEMRVALDGVDSRAAKGEPTRKQRALIDGLIRSHRQQTNLAEWHQEEEE